MTKKLKKIKSCRNCKGCGRVGLVKCPCCSGNGWVPNDKLIDAKTEGEAREIYDKQILK